MSKKKRLLHLKKKLSPSDETLSSSELDEVLGPHIYGTFQPAPVLRVPELDKAGAVPNRKELFIISAAPNHEPRIQRDERVDDCRFTVNEWYQKKLQEAEAERLSRQAGYNTIPGDLEQLMMEQLNQFVGEPNTPQTLNSALDAAKTALDIWKGRKPRYGNDWIYSTPKEAFDFLGVDLSNKPDMTGLIKGPKPMKPKKCKHTKYEIINGSAHMARCNYCQETFTVGHQYYLYDDHTAQCNCCWKYLDLLYPKSKPANFPEVVHQRELKQAKERRVHLEFTGDDAIKLENGLLSRFEARMQPELTRPLPKVVMPFQVEVIDHPCRIRVEKFGWKLIDGVNTLIIEGENLTLKEKQANIDGQRVAMALSAVQEREQKIKKRL